MRETGELSATPRRIAMPVPRSRTDTPRRIRPRGIVMPCSVNAASDASAAMVRPWLLSLRACTASAPVASARSQARRSPARLPSQRRASRRRPSRACVRAPGPPAVRRHDRVVRPIRARAPPRPTSGRVGGPIRAPVGYHQNESPARQSRVIALRAPAITASSLWAGITIKNLIGSGLACTARDRTTTQPPAVRGVPHRSGLAVRSESPGRQRDP